MTLGVALPSPHPLGPGRLLPSMFVPNNPSLRRDPTANTSKNTHHPKLPHLEKKSAGFQKDINKNPNLSENVISEWKNIAIADEPTVRGILLYSVERNT